MGGSMKKFAADRPLADPDVAARKIVEIANGVEAVQDGRIYIERVNAPFLAAGGSGDDLLTPFRDSSATPDNGDDPCSCSLRRERGLRGSR
jgi:hypothetical protein